MCLRAVACAEVDPLLDCKAGDDPGQSHASRFECRPRPYTSKYKCRKMQYGSDALILDTIKCRAEPCIEMRVQAKVVHLDTRTDRCSTEAMHSYQVQVQNAAILTSHDSIKLLMKGSDFVAVPFTKENWRFEQLGTVS